MISHGQGLQSDFTTGMQEQTWGCRAAGVPWSSVLRAAPTLRPPLPWDRQSQDVNHGVSSSVRLMSVLLQSNTFHQKWPHGVSHECASSKQHVPPKVATLYAWRGCTPECGSRAYFSPDAIHLCSSFFSLFSETIFDYQSSHTRLDEQTSETWGSISPFLLSSGITST